MKIITLIFLSVFINNITVHARPIKTPRHVFSYMNERMKDHPGDYPFPTDMTFCQFADHRILPTTTYFDPDIVKKGDTIFLMDWYISWFVKYVHLQIRHPYILISNDSDKWHPERGGLEYNNKCWWPPSIEATRTLLYDPKVAAWFCKNMIISRHPKIIQIPIGQNIIYWGNFPEKDCLLNLAKESMNKAHLLYMNMQLASHPSRPVIANLFENEPYCLSRLNYVARGSTNLSRTQFYHELSQAVFTVAPPGYGPDTVRFWEAIVLDCIPIVQHSKLDDLYSDLPVLFVHSWEQIDEGYLKEKYQEIMEKPYSKEKVYFDFWAKKIGDIQEQVRESKNTFSNLESTKFSYETINNLYTVLKKHASFSGSKLFCKGAIMGLRPFQIVETCPFLFKLYVQDEWGASKGESSTAHLKKFTDDDLIKKNNTIIVLNNQDDLLISHRNQFQLNTHFFFDLSYLRHSLLSDLNYTYSKAPSKTLICGNLANDAYVKEILQMFAEKHQIQIAYQGDIWYIIKS